MTHPDALVPDAALAAVRGADRPDTGPRPSELWRARHPNGGPVILVLVREQRAGGDVVAIPVTLDTEMADADTIVVPADSSPLGVALALFTSRATTLDAAVLMDRLGVLEPDAASVGTGATLVSSIDERGEYHAALADAMAGLAPERAETPEVHGDFWPFDSTSDGAALLRTLHQSLSGSRPNARIAPTRQAAALVTELDAFVLVAPLDIALDDAGLLAVARDLLHADQLLNAVCLVERASPFNAVVIGRRDVVDAIETPSGELRPPQQSRTPAPVGEVLSKFLDVTISPFGRLASTMVDAHALDSRGLAVEVSSDAVRTVEASARGFKVEGKRPGYERVTKHKAAIIRLVEEALNGTDVDVATILEDDE
jgi:hypothetical protein